MDEPIRKKGDVWCVGIGFDRDWEGDNGVWVTGPTGLSKLTRCVLDGESQSSFITRSIINDLKLEVIDHRDLAISAFESTAVPSQRRLVRLDLRGIWTNSTTCATALESSHAFTPQPAVPHDV